MQRHGFVISIINEKVEIILNNRETENSCTIKQTGSEAVQNAGCSGGTNCSACSGCGFAKQDSGLFVVNGNKIIALNKTGKTLKRGDRVIVEINEKKVKKQAVFSVIFPIFFSVLFLVIASSFFKTEGARISGFFVGLAIGIGSAFLFNKISGEKNLPEVLD